jgi:hypothetical protein
MVMEIPLAVTIVTTKVMGMVMAAQQMVMAVAMVMVMAVVMAMAMALMKVMVAAMAEVILLEGKL